MVDKQNETKLFWQQSCCTSFIGTVALKQPVTHTFVPDCLNLFIASTAWSELCISGRVASGWVNTFTGHSKFIASEPFCNGHTYRNMLVRIVFTTGLNGIPRLYLWHFILLCAGMVSWFWPWIRRVIREVWWDSWYSVEEHLKCHVVDLFVRIKYDTNQGEKLFQ